MPCVVRCKHAFLLASRVRPVVSVDKLCSHTESLEIIELLRRKRLINFKNIIYIEIEMYKNLPG